MLQPSPRHQMEQLFELFSSQYVQMTVAEKTNEDEDWTNIHTSHYLDVIMVTNSEEK